MVAVGTLHHASTFAREVCSTLRQGQSQLGGMDREDLKAPLEVAERTIWMIESYVEDRVKANQMAWKTAIKMVDAIDKLMQLLKNLATSRSQEARLEGQVQELRKACKTVVWELSCNCADTEAGKLEVDTVSIPECCNQLCDAIVKILADNTALSEKTLEEFQKFSIAWDEVRCRDMLHDDWAQNLASQDKTRKQIRHLEQAKESCRADFRAQWAAAKERAESAACDMIQGLEKEYTKAMTEFNDEIRDWKTRDFRLTTKLAESKQRWDNFMAVLGIPDSWIEFRTERADDLAKVLIFIKMKSILQFSSSLLNDDENVVPGELRALVRSLTRVLEDDEGLDITAVWLLAWRIQELLRDQFQSTVGFLANLTEAELSSSLQPMVTSWEGCEQVLDEFVALARDLQPEILRDQPQRMWP
jgi:hypothetical protein